jgi:hypothetical protein
LASISFFKTTHPSLVFFSPPSDTCQVLSKQIKGSFLLVLFKHRVKPQDECFTEVRDPQVGAKGVSNFCKFEIPGIHGLYMASKLGIAFLSP